ncbi:hypothetical protein ALC57_18328, partial [Trachymyrmex cornetzi]
NVQVIINYSVVMYELGLTAFTRRSFTRIWNALQDFDENMRRLGYARKETRTAIVAWFLVIMTTIIWMAINRIGMYAFLETWTSNMKYMIPYIGTSIAIYKFVAITIFLGQRFDHLNSVAIQNLPSTSIRDIGTIISKKDYVEYSLEFLNRKLKFSAGGCFYVNLPLLRSVRKKSKRCKTF